jgi:sirohydrochlorin ferrochelatase
MTAPALVALAHGSRDPRSAATVRAMLAQVRALRPDLRVDVAFLDHCAPSPAKVFDRLVRAGFEEAVVVPLLLTDAFHARVDVPAAVAATGRLHVCATPVLGFDPVMLHLLDLRLRTALSAARVRELDGLVLAAAGSSDPLATRAVARVARQWGLRHRLQTLVAFASTAPPATGEAVRALRADGRRHIAVGSYFLAPGQLPDRAAELALEAGAVAVAEPLGADPRIARLIVSRYLVGAVEMLPLPA